MTLTSIITEAPAVEGGQRVLSIALFLAFVAVTLGITVYMGKRTKTAEDFYAAGRSISGIQNGVAISGDYMSAASFLGITGLIALYGYDGFLYSVGFLVAYLVVLLFVAEPLRNAGKFTMADVLAFRLRQRPVRTAAAISTVTVSLFYLLAQMAGAGALVSLLLGVTDPLGKSLTIVVVGALMISYVLIGGMKATTWVQIIKAVLLLGGTLLISVMVGLKFGFNMSSMMDAATAGSGNPDYLSPGNKYTNPVDLFSLGMALVLGTAGLPHILTRFYTVPTARAARTSVNWAIGIIGGFYLMTMFLGFGAAALVGASTITSADKAGNAAAPQLAQVLGGGAGTTGGTIMMATISAIAFATILAVVAGLTLAASSSFAHDFWGNVVKKGKITGKEEVKVARTTTLVVGVIAIVLGILAQGQNIAFLVGLAFAVAASANLPVILFSLFWKGFTTRGAVWGIYGGLISSLVLVAISPVGIGSPTSLFIKEGIDPIFPLSNPGIVSIPLGFFLAWLGSITEKDQGSLDKYPEMDVRSLTGAGAH
jgi:cation/acetate symporter